MYIFISIAEEYMIVKIWNLFYGLYLKICERFTWFRNFVLYAIIGLMAAVLDYSIFFLLNHVFSVAPEYASLTGNICGFLFTFSGNTFYNFKKSTHVLFRFISYFCITIGGMTLSTLLIYYCKDKINVYFLKALLVLFVIPVIQFILNKKITYRDFDDNESSSVSCGWKQKTFLQKFFVVFILLSALMWVIVPASYYSSLHFDPAETLMWGSTFNWGNAKHPPMSGYMLYHFCRIFGFQNFAIFLCSQICVTIGFIYIYKLSRCFFDRDRSVMATLLITFYFFYNYETPKFNANIPHLLFMPMMCYYFYRGCVANKLYHWILVAVAAAGACLSKYSAGVLGLSFVLFLIFDKNARRVLLSVKPYIGGIVFFALMTPHILHLIRTDFLVMDYINHGNAVKYSYFMQIIVLCGAVILPLLCMSAANYICCWVGGKKFPGFKLTVSNLPALKYSSCIIGGQAAFLICMGIAGHRLMTIWTFPLFLTAGIFIMSFNPLQLSERTKRTFAILCSVFALIMALIPLTYYNIRSKSRYHLDKNELRAAAEKFYRQQTGRDIPFVIGDIWLSSMLQNSLQYQVKACPLFDPILTGLHAEKIKKHGAIVVSFIPDNTGETTRNLCSTALKWQEIKIDYCARFGKRKTLKFFLAVLPPAAGCNQGKQI